MLLLTSLTFSKPSNFLILFSFPCFKTTKPKTGTLLFSQYGDEPHHGVPQPINSLPLSSTNTQSPLIISASKYLFHNSA